jgi:hypothetical protein
MENPQNSAAIGSDPRNADCLETDSRLKGSGISGQSRFLGNNDLSSRSESESELVVESCLS